MKIKLRTYPLSSKLTVINGALLCLDIFLTLGIFILCLMILGGPGIDISPIVFVVLFVPSIIFFIVVHIFINKYTDKKYDDILEKHQETNTMLIIEKPEDIKDKLLTHPATVTFTRIHNFEARLIKIKYLINGREYSLKNGETINFTTNTALNTIEIKNASKDLNYFTVSDAEQISIEYSVYKLKNVQRKQNI